LDLRIEFEESPQSFSIIESNLVYPRSSFTNPIHFLFEVLWRFKTLTNSITMRLLIALFFLSLSTLAFSQQHIIDELAADMERNKSMSLSYVDAMPSDKFTYSPNDELRTFAQQFLHLSQGLIGLSSNGTGADPIFKGENLEANEDYHTKAEVQRIVTESYDFAIQSIKEMDAETLTEIVKRGQFEVTRLGWVNKALEHNTHHKGQAVIYLRMNGITPPQYQLF